MTGEWSASARSRRAITGIATGAALLASVPLAVLPHLTATAATGDKSSNACTLATPAGQVQHVIDIVFDNVHFTRDNPKVPSDLEQMPHLLNFLEHNGVLLSDEHTPLIAHTADDILTTLTGVYGDKHGQPVANSYGVFNTDGSVSFASSFAYWTDPVANSSTTDTTPTVRVSPRICSRCRTC